MSNEGKAIEAAAEAIEEAEPKPVNNLITLSNGVVLKLKSVPPFLVRQAVLKVERPKPPRMFIEDKGREEENPNDPDYIQQLAGYQAQTIDAAINVLLAAGTEIVSVPDGVSKPEDDDWLDVLDVLAIEVRRDSPTARRLAWLRCYGIATAADITRITKAVKEGVGLTEEEVNQIAQSFRSGTVRGTDNGVSPEAP